MQDILHNTIRHLISMFMLIVGYDLLVMTSCCLHFASNKQLPASLLFFTFQMIHRHFVITIKEQKMIFTQGVFPLETKVTQCFYYVLLTIAKNLTSCSSPVNSFTSWQPFCAREALKS